MSLLPSGRLKIDGDRKNMPYLVQAPCHFCGFTRNFVDRMQVIDLQCVNYIKRDEASFDHDPATGKRFSQAGCWASFSSVIRSGSRSRGKLRADRRYLSRSGVATWGHGSKICRSLLGGRVPSFALDVNRAGRGYAWARTLQLATPFHGFEHGDLVGVLDVAAYRNSHSDARYFEPGAP